MMTLNRARWAGRTFAGGFTLTEILVAMAIVGILAAIGVLQYQSHALRARVAGALEFASEARTRVALDLAQDKNIKTDLLSNSGGAINDITGLVWYPAKSGEPVTGHILVTMNLPGQGVRNAFALELRRGAVWQCVNAARYADPATALDNDYLPAACRDDAAPIATQPNAPAAPSLDVASACIGGDPGSFKTKATDKGKSQACAPEKSAIGAAAGGGGSSNPSGGTSSNASASTGNSSSDGNTANLPGSTSSADGKAGSTAAAVTPGKTAEGTNATADARSSGGSSAGSGDGTRGQGPGSGFTTQGGSTILCGQYFEAVNNTCALSGSASPRVCRSEKENCEVAHVSGRDCPAAQPFAANVVENVSDGTRYVTRRCLSLSEAFQGVKKNRETGACANYDVDKPSYARFTCVFPCYGIDCNRSVVPADFATRLTWDNDVVEPGSGRKRAKNGTDLPDLFDAWACPRGAIPDKTTVGRCVREPATAASADGKAPAGVKSGK